MAGAPACIHEDTLISVSDGRRYVSVKQLYLENKIIPVWSYNIKTKVYEIKNARIIKQVNRKPMVKITLDDGSHFICTKDHKLLTNNLKYTECQNIHNLSIIPFKRSTTKRGYWEIRNSDDRVEYVNIFKHYNPDKDLSGHNIHHIDFSKTNDDITNLQYLTIKEHILIHPPSLWTIQKDVDSTHTKEEVSNALEDSYTRCEAADILDITHKQLYELMCYYEIGKLCKRKLAENTREDLSNRMKENNPYSKFTEEEKVKFATHKGSENGRWINVENDYLLKIGKDLIDQHKKLTKVMWIEMAKENKLPQCPENRFNYSWNEFVEKCNDYNHKIKNIEELPDLFDCYDLQVEENNNFAIVTKITKNIQSGIILRNCGDLMKLSIEVDDNGIIKDSKFLVFGCGSAVASSSYATELLKDKHIEEAGQHKK